MNSYGRKKILEVLVKAEDLLYDPKMGANVREVFGYIGFVQKPAVREVFLNCTKTTGV